LPQTNALPQIDELSDGPNHSLHHPSKEKYQFEIDDASYPNLRVLEHAEQDSKKISGRYRAP